MAGFFSGLAKQKFGQVPGYGQGIGDGRIEQQQYDMMQDQGGAGAPDMGSMTRKPFFQRSGVKQGIGILGDTLSILGGGQATYAPAMVDQRKQDAEIRARLQAQSEQRKAGREDKQWEWANKPRDPVNPQYFDDNAGNRYSYDPVTGQKKTIFIDPNDKQFIQDGRLITVPNVLRSGGQSVTAPPQAHIDALLTNPDKAADFDAKYGPGASARYLQGGPVSQAPATFPRR